MIESNIIEWLDFGDSIQKIDIYSKKNLLRIFKYFRTLIKNKPSALLDILFIIISFIQLLCLSSYFASSEREIVIQILQYLNNVFLLSNTINNPEAYLHLIITTNIILYINVIIMVIIFSTIKRLNLKYLAFIVNLINSIVFYYFLAIIHEIIIIAFWCENGQHKILQFKCFSNKVHLYIIFLLLLIYLLYIFISFSYSLFYNEIGSITANKNEKIIRIKCHYESFYLFTRIVIFLICFIIKIKSSNSISKLVYIGINLIVSIFMSIYVYKYVYYYNNKINYIIYIGWFFCTWFSFCILLKMSLNINNISSSIIIGWIIIILLMYKMNKMKEILLVTESNIFEIKNIKSIEMYNNILLDKLSNKKEFSSKIILYGNIKSFEDYCNNNPEINYHYQKLLNDNNLNNKYSKEDDLPILSIIYIIYSTLLEKSLFKEEIALYMSYFLINKLNNPSYAILLASKIKTSGLGLYYKYLLTEEIKEYLSDKLEYLKKESLKHVQIGRLILYYLYIDLFKIKIYDGITNQIDYFDILKNNITTSKTTENLLKTGDNILKTRKDILNIWKRVIELNPFSDETYKDYMLYLDTILQDEILVREEEKNYIIIKQNKYEEKNNVYHSMFLIDTSSILLIDGFFSVGKILYASPNFSLVFSYNGKEILNYTVDDLLPSVIQSFHKEIIEEAIKYSNLNYRFKKQINSFLKNKNGGLYNIKLFVKPVPNINYGLMYFAYLQKLKQGNFVIILDKDLKISGFTEMGNIGSTFTMGVGYNLSHNLYGYHIGLIIPDILPLLEYKNEEFYINKKDLELKGYLYQITSFSDIKAKVKNILEKIKNSTVKDKQLQYEDVLQNITEEFNDLISELNKQKIKPFSIFYKVQMFSFLDDKYKYYRINITDDIITGNERENILNKELDTNKKLKNSNNIDYKSNNSKNSKDNEKKIQKINVKNIKIKKQLLDNNLDINDEINNIEQNVDLINNQKENNEKNKEKDIKKNIIKSVSSFDSQTNNIDNNNFIRIKMSLINRKEGFPQKLMKYLSLILIITSIVFIIYKNIILKKYLNNMSIFLESNLIFNMTKFSVAIIYIIVTNIKWELHNCLIEEGQIPFSSLYELILKNNIKYLLDYKNALSNFDEEFEDIIEAKTFLDLHIFGYTEKEKLQLCFDNYLLYIINGGIDIINNHKTLLSKSKEANYDINNLTIGYSDLLDLQNQTYLLYISDINGFSKEEEYNKIKNLSNIFPLILNSITLIGFLIIYLIIIAKMYNVQLFFIEKLINFNSPNFDKYVKNLEEIKKKLQNNFEEEDKDDIDINDSISKNNTKKEEENENKSKLNLKKKSKKSKKKDPNKTGKLMKQKNNKIKIISSYFRKYNIFFAIKILIIVFISISYFIILLYVEIDNKKNLILFDGINNEILNVFKESFDIFITKFKKELEYFENTLEKCDKGEKPLYKMTIPTIKEIKIPNFGNNIMQLISDFGFKGKTISNFTLLFSESACKCLSNNSFGYDMCIENFGDFLLQGMEHAVSKINSFFESIIEELKSINDNAKLFKEIFNKSKFHSFEVFIMHFYQKSIIITYEIFNDLRKELLDKIISLLKLILIIYIIINILLLLYLFYLLYIASQLGNSFFTFIAIIPFKYFFEDEKFYNEVINFGNSYYK